MEWTVVTVIIAIVGLLATVVKPIISLTQSITRLTTVVEQIDERLADQKEHSREAHQKLWDKNEQQDRRMDDHEKRLHDLDGK